MINRHLRRARIRKYNNMIALKICFLFIIMFFVFAVFKLTIKETSSISFHPIVVESGDTIWRLAKKSDLNSDTREIVDQIVTYNSLNNSIIRPGQVVYIPMTAPNSKLASTRR